MSRRLNRLAAAIARGWRAAWQAPAPPPAPAPPTPNAVRRRQVRIRPEDLARASASPDGAPVHPWVIPKPMKGVVPAGTKLAMDSAAGPYAYALEDVFAEGLSFMGYPALAELSQRPEYRRASEIIAFEMTRKWIKLQSTGTQQRPEKPEEPAAAAPGQPLPGQPAAPGAAPPGFPPAAPGAQDKAPPFGAPVPPKAPAVPTKPGFAPAEGASVPPEPGAVPPGQPGAEPEQADEPPIDPKAEKLLIIEAELERLDAQAVFRRAAELDGHFGRAQIFIDTGIEDPAELLTKLSETMEKIKATGIERLTVVEPIWTYPGNYNSTNPLKPDFYRPETWFVLGKEVHRSRMITIIGRPVSDMLKPAYAFGGLSLTQMMRPYVDNWLRTRQSVSDLLHAFTVMVLKTNMDSVLSSGAGGEDQAAPGSADFGADLFTRVDFFNRVRDNRGTMVIDKDTEDFANVSAPLGTLDHLQAQSQEQMCAATGIPLVKFTGITPSGLNASSDGEIRVFYDLIGALQEAVFREELTRLINIIQLHKFGDIDKEITFVFNPLWSASESEIAGTRKTEADTDAVYIDKGVLDPIEVRQRLATQADSPYASIDVSQVPDPPAPPGGNPMMGGMGPPGPGEEDEGGEAPPGEAFGATPTPPAVSRETGGWTAKPKAAQDIGGGGGPEPVR